MAQFKERLLSIMDQKNHWAWSRITGASVTKDQLLIHFQQEYEVYVRDFPIFLARILGRMDASAWQLKREFAENIYEEQTGGLSKAYSHHLSHPELFLKMMRGLKYKDSHFEKIDLLPTSLAYRSYLDLITLTYDWRIAAAVLTLFVEGSCEDRQRMKKDYKPLNNLQTKLKNHSLHKYHGLSLSDMDLVKAHHAIEGDHRRSAWDTLLKWIPSHMENDVDLALQRSLDLWLLFRDGVSVEMGLENSEYQKLATITA